MAAVSRERRSTLADSLPFGEGHYRELKRKQLIRLSTSYLAPLIILIIYFLFQYSQLRTESQNLHLTAIAENQANTLNLFLTERVVNLSNLVNSPRLLNHHGSEALALYLEDLYRISETFVDLGFFNAEGVQISYAGPYPSLEKRNYGSEPWFQNLKNSASDFIITDIYLGFRRRPHFTIAVKRILGEESFILRATLDPAKIYEYMTSLEGANEVFISIVNQEGFYQLVTPHIGGPLESSTIVPPTEPRLGAEEVEIRGSSVFYAYAWLRTADWALIVQPTPEGESGLFSRPTRTLLLFSLPLVLIVTVAIFLRADKIVEGYKQRDRTQAQLTHAAKLASVGELAAGIAHEINNPLAVINEEAGLMKDLMNPEFGPAPSHEDLAERLTRIQASVFRCRDITHKLLGFVRKSEIELKPHKLETLIEGVVEGLLGPELAVSNVELIRDYDTRNPVHTDGNQLQQVLLNIVNNAVDALEGRPGRIQISTREGESQFQICISDTGTGMTSEQMEKIFLPFYTTKQVGKGTGLGLSVSYGIMRDLGGSIEVESVLGEGSTFTLTLPKREES